MNSDSEYKLRSKSNSRSNTSMSFKVPRCKVVRMTPAEKKFQEEKKKRDERITSIALCAKWSKMKPDVPYI